MTDYCSNKNRLLSGKSSTRGASASAKFASPVQRKKNESEKSDGSNPFPDDVYEDTGDDIEELPNPAESGLETAVVVKIMKNGIEVSDIFCIWLPFRQFFSQEMTLNLSHCILIYSLYYF